MFREQTLNLMTSFSVTGPRIWNSLSLPASLQQLDTELGIKGISVWRERGALVTL